MNDNVNCKHYDAENGWCKKRSDWSDPMPYIEYCPKSPCEYAEPIEQPMSDEDIINALGFCFAVGDCEHCAYADKPCQELMADALDIINRQKAEIERLNHIRAELSKENEEQDQAIINALHHMKVVRAEAIKEFAERLKRDITINNTEDGCLIYSIDYGCLIEDIDNLVKEMTEEKE